MCYTEEQKALISGLIGTQILGRAQSKTLRESFYTVHERLHKGELGYSDLRRIESALELVTPQSCESCNKEGYRDLVETLMVTRLMMRSAR